MIINIFRSFNLYAFFVYLLDSVVTIACWKLLLTFLQWNRLVLIQLMSQTDLVLHPNQTKMP